MIQSYQSEINSYKHIYQFNETHDNVINFPEIYGNQFVSIFSTEIQVSGLFYIAGGPAIFMEILQQQRPATNHQFFEGLRQLIFLHRAGIRHGEIKLEKMIYTNKFIFIGFDKAVVSSSSVQIPDFYRDLNEYIKVWHQTMKEYPWCAPSKASIREIYWVMRVGNHPPYFESE